MSLIYLPTNNRNIRFTKETLRTEKINKDTGEAIIRNEVFIVYKDYLTGFSFPHPLTEFLRKWRNNRFSTMNQKAKDIVPFLNYILIDNSEIYKLNSLWEITFQHGNDFLNYKGESVSKGTVQQYEQTLTQFYYFLAEKLLLKYIGLNNFKTITKMVNQKTITTIASPFDEVYYPNKSKKSEKIHEIANELILPFIDTAIMHAPYIALGIYFQFFGGLRIGEVVNLTREAITEAGSYGLNGFVLNLRKRDLRPDITSNEGKGEVKKDRYQVVMPILGLSYKLFKSHIETYGYNKQSGALFLNQTGKSKGLAMTEPNYRYHFNRVKTIFLKRLRNSCDSLLKGHAERLGMKNWSTHIGRGIFSNLIADVSDNAMKIAIMRGDSSLDSALVYLSDCSSMAKKVEQNLNSMYRSLLENNA